MRPIEYMVLVMKVSMNLTTSVLAYPSLKVLIENNVPWIYGAKISLNTSI